MATESTWPTVVGMYRTGAISGIVGAADAGTNSAPFDIINVSMYFIISVPQ